MTICSQILSVLNVNFVEYFNKRQAESNEIRNIDACVYLKRFFIHWGKEWGPHFLLCKLTVHRRVIIL